MLSIFSCDSWQSVCLLWRNVYLDLLPIFWLGCLFFWYWAPWAVCIFWRLIPCWSLHLQMFSPFCGLSFCFVYGSFAVQKLLSLIIAGESINWYNYFGKRDWHYLLKLTIHILYNQEISLLRIYPRNSCTYTCGDIHNNVCGSVYRSKNPESTQIPSD